MNQSDARGRIHSFQSLGTVDGPGVRSVIFLQGCPLRCICCHNPDTWDFSGGEPASSDELVERVQRYRAYYGERGGVTVSGGEPLAQAEFVCELFKKLKSRGIHTCLDTSGYRLDACVRELLTYTDTVLLDYKYTNGEDYLKYTSCEIGAPRAFLDYLESVGKETWLRFVVIPTLNDSERSLLELARVQREYSCIKKVELLPLRKLCIEKYHEMGTEFPLAHIPEPSREQIEALYRKYGFKRDV